MNISYEEVLLLGIPAYVSLIISIISFLSRYFKPRVSIEIPFERYHASYSPHTISPYYLDYKPELFRKSRCLKIYVTNNSGDKPTTIHKIEFHIGNTSLICPFDFTLDPKDTKEMYIPIDHPLTWSDSIRPRKNDNFSAKCFIIIKHSYGVSKSKYFNMEWNPLNLKKVKEILDKRGIESELTDGVLEVRLGKSKYHVLDDGRIKEGRTYFTNEIHRAIKDAINRDYLKKVPF